MYDGGSKFNTDIETDFEGYASAANAERAAEIQGNWMIRVFEMYKVFNQEKITGPLSNFYSKKLYHTEGLRFYNWLSRHFKK